MNSPKVSVITPAFNAARHINCAIESVRSQTFDSWELIVIDDGSEDATASIVDAYQDSRILLFRQANLGVSAARNAGLQIMRGEYFTFLDADDQLPPRALELLVDRMTTFSELDFLAGRVVQRDHEGNLPTWQPSFSGDPLRQFVRLNPSVFYGVCLFLRRRSDIRYKFREGLRHCEDLLFFIEIAAQTKQARFDFLTETVYIRNSEPGSAMADLDGLLEGYRELFQWVWRISDRRIRLIDKLYLKLRYVRIMVLSYAHERQYLKALRVLLDLTRL